MKPETQARRVRNLLRGPILKGRLLLLLIGFIFNAAAARAQLHNENSVLPSDFLNQVQGLYNANQAIREDQTLESFRASMDIATFSNQYKTTDNSSLWAIIQNDSLRNMCGGNFEDSLFNTSEWSGGYGYIPLSGNNNPLTAIYTSGFVPAPNSMMNAPVNSNCPTTAGISIPEHATEHHQTIVTQGNDPLLGALLQRTSSPSSNYAFRLGNSCVQYGTEYISKKFVVTGNGIIKFNYALVMNGTHNATSNPAFYVKVYDNSGNLISNAVYLDPISGLPMDQIVSSSTDPFFQHKGIDTNYRDWTCAKIDLQGYIGQTVTVALITIDCSGGAHFAYAYMDGWCGNCEGATTGTITAVADSCIVPGAQVEVMYTLPVIGPDTGTVNLDLTFYQNGLPISYTITSPVLTTNGSYIFNLDPGQLPCDGSGYDIVATAHYNINSASYSVTYPDPMTTDGFKTGTNNDIVCCQSDSIICAQTNVRLTPSPMGCCYLVEISNQYSSSYFSGISITSSTVNISSVSSGNTWSTIAYQTPGQVIFEKTFGTSGIPATAGGWQTVGTICFAGTGSGSVSIGFIGPAPDNDTLCEKTFPVSCGTPVDTTCAAITDLTAACDSGVVTMRFKVKNNANFTMRGITLYSQNPNVNTTPTFIPIADLPPGQTTSVFYETVLQVANGDSTACFFFAACDQNTVPGENGQYPQFCCMDSILYCVTLPSCQPCDAIDVTAVRDSGSSCCYKLNLVNNYTAGTLKCVRFRGQNGAQFALLSGWNIQSPVSSNNVTMCAPGGTIHNISYTDFARFCLTGTSTPPHQVTLEFIDDNDSVVCTRTLTFDSCELVQPTCATIVDDSLYCFDTTTRYTFYVKNNSPFDIYQLDVRISDTSVHVDQNIIIASPPIATGATGGPFTVTLTDGWQAGKDFCIYLSAHNNVYNPDSGISATQCCTDSLAVLCFPYFSCKQDSACCTCCDFSQLVIPTGITPNSDSYNDEYDLQNPDSCTNIRIVVYNRWGNIVYENANYNNDWKGTNKNGEQLPQGTYFVVIELSNGSKKGIYVDVRY